MTTRRPPLTHRPRPASQVYIGPDSASPYSSYISTPPDIPDLPEPPSPGSSSSSRTSGLPSPPATNSTGSGSTGDPASIAIRGGGNMLNGSNIKTFHAAFASAVAADDEHDDIDNDNDEDGEGEDNTARLDQQRRRSTSENVLALERVKSLTQRNKMVRASCRVYAALWFLTALDKLSSFSRLGSPAPSAGGTSSARRASVTRSPHPPALSSSSTSTSDSRSSHSNSNSNSNSSHSASSSSHRDTTSSSSHRDSASTSSSRDSTRPVLRRSRTQDSHQSGSETERDDDHDRDYSPQQRQRDLENRPTTPLAPRQRLVSAPASPQKHLTARQSNNQGSGSGSILRSPRRSKVSGLGLNLALDGGGGEGGEASSPEDVTRAALAAVASARTGTGTARRMNMSPTMAGSGKKRQPLPREWGASSNGNGRFSASPPPPSPPQHNTSPNKRHSLAGSTASTSSFSPSRHAHSNSTSSTSTIGSTPHGQRASTVRELARRHQARYLSEDFSSSNRDGGSSTGTGDGTGERERRQSLRAGSAERLTGRERERDRAGGDVFSPHERERTPARVEWADEARSRSASRQSAHGRAATSMDYTSYDREDEPRTAPLLRTYRSSAYVLDGGGVRSGSALGRNRDRDRGVSVERDREPDGERERYAPSPSPFGSVAQRRHGSGGGGGSGQQEHTKLMGDSLAMFEGHLSRIAGANNGAERTTNDLAQHAARIVSAAERLNGILRAGTAKALEEQIDAEVSGADRGVAGAELAEVWRRVGGEWREGLRGELCGISGMGAGRMKAEGVRALMRVAEGAQSQGGAMTAGYRLRGGTARLDSGRRVRLIYDTRRCRRPAMLPPMRRLLTPREQRELHASGGIVASDSQETVQPARPNVDYEPSPTPASRKQQNQTTLDRSRTLPPIAIPKPLPTLPSESTSTLRRNQTVTGATTTGGSSQRRRTITSSTVRGPGGLLPSTTTPTTAVTAHTVSNSPQAQGDNAARMAFPSLPRSDSDKSANGNGVRGRNNTVTFSRPSTVALTGLQMQHERERQRTISGTNNSNQLDPAAIAIAAAAGPSRPAEDTRKRSSAVADRPRMSLDGEMESTGRAADRSAAAGLSMANQKRERRRTVTEIWPPSAS
ncbi:hypothetical protein MSAN_01768100 [Mycena sanguinolenta]|uniref:Uncharacterized protein n=1 Tax=Mycena sanguinolenta TaxID=230812 RepID=A0A8H6XVY4_9AGAR|nr:hypothetical protein MSAN_01768100 [Mycena sanguinolenta]